MRKIIKFEKDISFLSSAAVGGYEEKRGPLGSYFDFTDDSDRFGMKTWEQAEAEMGRMALNLALKKTSFSRDKLDAVLAGDLENQCVASSCGLFSFGIPYIGLYSACSTFSEALLLLSSLLSSSSLNYGAVVTSSHNSAAERQFRTPVEYGGQRTPTSQWTATASGAFILGKGCGRVKIEEALIGKIVDGLTKDASNMGAAMARAAFDSIYTYFNFSGKNPSEFDYIITGDLGKYGSLILSELLSKDVCGAEKIHCDCGTLLYDYENQDCHSGASGAGCSSSVFSTYFLPKLESGQIKNVLLLATGALMSPSSVLQGKNILGIAPLVVIKSE